MSHSFINFSFIQFLLLTSLRVADPIPLTNAVNDVNAAMLLLFWFTHSIAESKYKTLSLD